MGARKKTRHALQKHKREKGKISISRYFQRFKDGDGVVLKIEPSVKKGVFHPRFQVPSRIGSAPGFNYRTRHGRGQPLVQQALENWRESQLRMDPKGSSLW